MQIVPPLRLDLLRELREVDADVVVVRADIGDAQVLALRQEVGVPGEHRDAGFLGRRQHARHRGGVGGRDRDAVDALGDQVGDDLDLLVTAAVLGRAGEEALDLVGADLVDRLFAAELRLVEERVVEVLRHHGDDQLVRCARLPGEEHTRRHGAGDECGTCQNSLILFPPLQKRRAAPWPS